MDINATFCRLYLKRVHQEVRHHFPQVKNLRKACGVLGPSRRGARNDYTAEICVTGFDRFWWYGRADNRDDARGKAWTAFMAKHGVE